MKKTIYTFVISIVICAISSFAARLELSENAKGHITQIIKKKDTIPADLSNSAIAGKEEIDGRPVIFEVTKAKRDDFFIQHLSRNVLLQQNVVFNSIKGAYCYNNVALQHIALNSTSTQVLGSLKTKAHAVLEKLLGKEKADRFVLANEETDYVKKCDTCEERILRKTYRFTREINGRHILDNTSFVRLTFSADQELSGFEIVNPDIRPVRNVERLIKAEAIENRLAQYAANKQTASKNGLNGIEKIGVTSIIAENGFNTYLSKKTEDKILLIPNISFYSNYQLENGEHFNNWAHFCIDADFVPDIDTNLIESSNR